MLVQTRNATWTNGRKCRCSTTTDILFLLSDASPVDRSKILPCTSCKQLTALNASVHASRHTLGNESALYRNHTCMSSSSEYEHAPSNLGSTQTACHSGDTHVQVENVFYGACPWHACARKSACTYHTRTLPAYEWHDAVLLHSQTPSTMGNMQNHMGTSCAQTTNDCWAFTGPDHRSCSDYMFSHMSDGAAS